MSWRKTFAYWSNTVWFYNTPKIIFFPFATVAVCCQLKSRRIALQLSGFEDVEIADDDQCVPHRSDRICNKYPFPWCKCLLIKNLLSILDVKILSIDVKHVLFLFMLAYVAKWQALKFVRVSYDINAFETFLTPFKLFHLYK